MSPFQQQSRTRKAIYAGLIVALFTGTLFYRRQVLEPKADQLVLREQTVGEADLAGSAVRLTLTGSRGIALCALWIMAIDRQTRHEWNELEVLVNSIIKLQPHFVTPWQFQSWNLAYNVSAECDDVKDKYFYISRGIQLLAEGERQNRNNPDLRFSVGYFYHGKFGLSDESDQFRSLFQLSCIDPLEREPSRFRKAGGIDLEQFRQFCAQHPSFVRRLREVQGLATPEAIVGYLEANRDVPSRFAPLPASGGPRPLASPLLPPERQFPVLPRRADLPHAEAAAEDRLDDTFDSYAAARTWFDYATETPPVPPPSTDPTEPFAHHDAARYRIPRTMLLVIFRGYPARAQSYLAERRQKEGWFDEGWEIDAGKQGAGRWFKDRVVVGDARHGSAAAWKRAAEMWESHGRRNALILDPALKLNPEQLSAQKRNRMLTNFAHFHEQARVESKPEAVAARKLFFQAEARRKAAETGPALRLFEEGLTAWRQILLDNLEFQKDVDIQEDAATIQYRWFRLLQEQYGSRTRPLLLAGDLLTSACLPSGVWLSTVNVLRANALPVGFVGPLDGVNRQGEPLIGPHARDRLRSRLGIINAQ